MDFFVFGDILWTCEDFLYLLHGIYITVCDFLGLLEDIYDIIQYVIKLHDTKNGSTIQKSEFIGDLYGFISRANFFLMRKNIFLIIFKIYFNII